MWRLITGCLSKLAAPSTSDTPEGFGQWLKGHIRFALAILSTPIVAAILELLSSFHKGPLAALPHTQQALLAKGLNLVAIIAILIAIGFAPEPPDDSGKEVSLENAFRRHWTRLWWFWAGMYVFKVLLEGIDSVNKLSPAQYIWLTSVSDFIGQAVNLQFVSAYFVLLKGDTDFRQSVHWARVFFLVLGLAILGETLWRISLVSSPQPIQFTSDVMVKATYGLLSAVTLALFVGRLESRHISPPTSVILALYFYACFQIFIAVSDPLRNYWTSRTQATPIPLNETQLKLWDRAEPGYSNPEDLALTANQTSELALTDPEKRWTNLKVTIHYRDAQWLTNLEAPMLLVSSNIIDFPSFASSREMFSRQKARRLAALSNAVAYSFVCVLKILLFLFVHWLISSGGLRRYFRRILDERSLANKSEPAAKSEAKDGVLIS